MYGETGLSLGVDDALFLTGNNIGRLNLEDQPISYTCVLI